MLIEILCTGDEILTGKTVNTNYSHMASRLNEVSLKNALGYNCWRQPRGSARSV